MATPQPALLAGDYTLSQLTNALAASYPRFLAWATNRVGGAGYMYSDGTQWLSIAVNGAQSGVLTLLSSQTVGETLIVGLSLGVRRYSVTVTGAAVGDRLLIALTGAPSNGTIQDAYVTATNTVSVGLLVPALGIGQVIAVPLAIYKITV